MPSPATPHRTPSRPLLGYALVAVAGVLIALTAAHHWPHQGDDGFIFFRHAERLAQGQWGWTDGVAPLEGYSSPLWLFLLTGLHTAGLATPLAAKILGGASLIALFAGVWALVRSLGGSMTSVGVAWLVLALLRPLTFWAFAGLETPLAAAVLVWTAWGLAKGRGRWAAPTGLLGLVRPEGPAMVLGVLLIVALRTRKWPPWKSTLVAVVPTIAWLGLRLVIYGDVLPNTFYAKAAGAPLEQAVRGLTYASTLTPALAVLAILLWIGRKRLTSSAAAAVIALAAGQLAIIIVGGGDWMWFGRLLVPVLPLVVVLSVWAAANAGPSKILAWLLPIALFPWLIPPGGWTAIATVQPMHPHTWQEGEMTLAEASAGEWIAANAARADLVAVNHAGALPWAAPEQRFLDMTGLLDRHIATSATGGMHNKYDVDHVFDQAPQWVVLHTRTPPAVDGSLTAADYWVGETALFNDPRFNQSYEPTGQIWQWEWVVEGASWTVVYRRK